MRLQLVLEVTFERVPRLLAALEDADDVNFGSITQVIMDTWSGGRVTLDDDESRLTVSGQYTCVELTRILRAPVH